MKARLAALCLLMLLATPTLHAATIVVRPDAGSIRFADAVRSAKSGDTIEVLSGTYRGEVAVIEQQRLTIRGIGARPVFVADGRIAEGKAMLVVRNGSVDIDNIEFRNARAADLNGAAIRFEKGSLQVRRCRFVDNENGILTSNFDDARLAIEDSEFADAPQTGGLNHLLYVGRIARLSVRGSRFHNGHTGHLIKSRAGENRIEYNLIFDGPGGQASYELEFPEGGTAFVIGNIIGQSAGSQNPAVVAFGAEARGDRPSALYLVHNTLVNEQPPGARFLRVWTERLPKEVKVHAINNLLIGPGLFDWGAPGSFVGTQHGLRSSLKDIDGLDFGLAEDSWLRGRAVDPLPIDDLLLRPSAEFALPVGTRPLPADARLSPGALHRR